MAFAGDVINQPLEDVDTSLNKIKMAFLDLDASKGDAHYLGLSHSPGRLFEAYQAWLTGKPKVRLAKSAAALRSSLAPRIQAITADLKIYLLNESVKVKDISEILIVGKTTVAISICGAIYVIREKHIYSAVSRMYSSLVKVSAMVDAHEMEEAAR
ncbi:hypothetical protein ACYPKM_03110 [Pseudomonas aeruginosa]